MKRLRGRRTPHQDLKGPLIEITQPSISNQWATGGPPLVLISHPSGMTPDEERFYTENRSTCLSQNWAWMGAPICPHLARKRSKGMAHYRRPPLEDSVPESWTTKHKQNKQERHPHHKGPTKSPKRGRRERITKGSQTKPNKTQDKHNPLSQCHSLPRRAVGHWRSQCLLMSTQIPTKGLNKRRPEKTMTHPRLQGLLKSWTDGPGPPRPGPVRRVGRGCHPDATSVS